MIDERASCIQHVRRNVSRTKVLLERRRSGTLTAGDSVVAAVPEDASLDQFVSSGKTDESETDDSVDSEPVGPEPTDSEASKDSAGYPEEEASVEQLGEADDQSEELVDLSAVEPAVSTFTWSPEGGECADCGASAERRWRSEGQRGGDLVCADCKEW